MYTLRFVLQKSSAVNIALSTSTRSMSLKLLKQQAYANGNWISAASNKTFDVTNPVDGSLVGVAPNMDVKDVEKVLQNAKDAFETWSDTTAKERSYLLRKWSELIANNSEELALLMTLESGKALIESRGEVAYGNSFVEWFSEEARRIEGEIVESPVKNRQMFLYRQPIGVAALITPWNFPLAMITRKASAALAAGCTVVARPAEDTPLTSLALAELAHQAGFPNGVFNVVTSNRTHAASIGKLFCESPLVAGISFTGSTLVGKILYKQCSSGIKRLALELGGNAPFIVFESADIDKAVQGAVAAKFRNCGQTCVSANRFYIQEPVFDEFLQKFKAATEKIKMGPGTEKDVLAGPLINDMQAKKVFDIVEDAIKKGAKVILGGKPATSIGKLFYYPTILTNINKNMICAQDEIFGPVACCSSFKTEEEVLKISNCTNSGLAGYFYSTNVSQIFRVSKKLEVGMVGVNEGLISAAEAAFGGVKESGLGREGSKHGIEDFNYIKYMCLGNL